MATLHGQNLQVAARNVARLAINETGADLRAHAVGVPVLVVAYATFWIASGLIGLWQIDSAAMIVSKALGEAGARWSVLVGSLADILVGIGLCFRRTFVSACVAAIAVCAF